MIYLWQCLYEEKNAKFLKKSPIKYTSLNHMVPERNNSTDQRQTYWITGGLV